MRTILAVLLTMIATAAPAQDWSVDVYGGISLERTVIWDGDSYDIDQGNAFGLTVYHNSLLSGFSVGADLMGTRALYIGYPGEYVETLSLMAVIRKEFPLGTAAGAYVSGGLGLIENTFDDNGIDYSEVVPGAQVAVGVRTPVGQNVSVFGEVKHQVGLDDAYLEGQDVEQSYAAANVLVGLSFDF